MSETREMMIRKAITAMQESDAWPTVFRPETGRALAEAAIDAVAAAHLHDALAEMVAQHPKSSRRYGHEGSPVRLQQEDQEAAYDDAVSALALARARGEKP